MVFFTCPVCDEKFSSHAEMCPEFGCPTSIAESWKQRLPLPDSATLSAMPSEFQSSSTSVEGNSSISSSKPRSSSALDLDLGRGVTLRLALIPAGKFLMGSPESENGRFDVEKQHKVMISNPFYMGIHQVTQAQYEAVMGANPSIFKGNNLPVETVNWHCAVEFCRKLSETTGRNVRLPTEAEWEYACRAGTTTPFYFGKTISTDLANYSGMDDAYGYGSEGEDRGRTTPVGSFLANAWGLYDMHGNVLEWCSDWYGNYPDGEVTDPQGPSDGDKRILRGGSWLDDPVLCRSAYRGLDLPGRRDFFIGFRVSLD